MHLVHEQDGLPPRAEVPAGLVQHGADLLDARPSPRTARRTRPRSAGTRPPRWSSCRCRAVPRGAPTSPRPPPADATVTRARADAPGRRSRRGSGAASARPAVAGPVASARLPPRSGRRRDQATESPHSSWSPNGVSTTLRLTALQASTSDAERRSRLALGRRASMCAALHRRWPPARWVRPGCPARRLRVHPGLPALLRAIGAGASVSGSTPPPDFGNAMTSRIESLPASSARSGPSRTRSRRAAARRRRRRRAGTRTSPGPPRSQPHHREHPLLDVARGGYGSSRRRSRCRCRPGRTPRPAPCPGRGRRSPVRAR